MNCINCDRRAMFEYKISKVESILYCGKCLPSFLNDRKKAGLLTITEEYKEDQTSALAAFLFASSCTSVVWGIPNSHNSPNHFPN